MFKPILRTITNAILSVSAPSTGRQLGLGNRVWRGTENLGRMFPEQIKVNGEITESDISSMRDAAEKMSVKAQITSDYATEVETYLDSYAGYIESKAGIVRNAALARSRVADAEADMAGAMLNSELTVQKAKKKLLEMQQKTLPQILQATIYADGGGNSNSGGILANLFKSKRG